MGEARRPQPRADLFLHSREFAIRAAEFAGRLVAMTGCTEAAAKKEVDASISRLFTWAAYADKFGGAVQETTLYGLTAMVNEPVGVIAIACPDESPLLSFVSLVMPAVVRGNAVVVVPSEKHPLCATDLYQVLDTSDLPGGVINIVTASATCCLARSSSTRRSTACGTSETRRDRTTSSCCRRRT